MRRWLFSAATLLGLALAPRGALHAQGAPGADADVLPTTQGFACQILPAEKVDLSSPSLGVLADILVDRGDHVRAGQVIAHLRSEIEQADVADAQMRAEATGTLRSRQAHLALAERTLRRSRDLASQNFISAHDFDQMTSDRDVAAADVVAAEEALSVARMELASAQARLAVRTITSPIDGVVTNRALSRGEQVGEKPIVTIENIDQLRVEAAVPADLFGRLKLGMQGRVHFDIAGVAPLLAPLSLIDPVIDPTSNTLPIRFVIDNTRLHLPAGAKCSVEFPGLS